MSLKRTRKSPICLYVSSAFFLSFFFCFFLTTAGNRYQPGSVQRALLVVEDSDVPLTTCQCALHTSAISRMQHHRLQPLFWFHSLLHSISNASHSSHLLIIIIGNFWRKKVKILLFQGQNFGVKVKILSLISCVIRNWNCCHYHHFVGTTGAFCNDKRRSKRPLLCETVLSIVPTVAVVQQLFTGALNTPNLTFSSI